MDSKVVTPLLASPATIDATVVSGTTFFNAPPIA
jgi:hypothetical protein